MLIIILFSIPYHPRIHVPADGACGASGIRIQSQYYIRALGDAANQGQEVSLSNSTILGLLWNTLDDTLTFRFNTRAFRDTLMDGTGPLTKREMLIVVMSIFDPLGLVAYLLVEAKIILREA